MNGLELIRRTMRRGSEAAPFYGPGGIGGGWLRGFLPQANFDYESEVGDLWQNGVIATGIAKMAGAMADMPFVIQRKVLDHDGRAVWKEIDHPLATLLNDQPNEWYDGTVLASGIALSDQCDGNVYLFAPPNRLGEPTSLYYLPHFQVEPKADIGNESGAKLITHYEYRPLGSGEVSYLPREWVIHLRHGIDPRNTMKGWSPLKSDLREVFSDNQASTFTAALLRNFAVPSLALAIKDKPLPVNQVAEYVTKLREQFRGEGVGKPALVPMPVELLKLGFSPSEMALGQMRGMPVARIAASMGFDPMFLNLPSDQKTYSNFEEANKAGHLEIYAKRIRYAQQITQQLVRRYMGRDDLRVWVNSRQCAALQESVNELHERVRKDWEAGLIDRATACGLTDYPFGESDHGCYKPDLAGR